MKYIEEFRNHAAAQALVREIHRISGGRRIRIMEVCGGHTMAIFKYGLPGLLPANIELISGPGCPVCVTSNSFIDHAIELAKDRGTLIATFGDLIRVPGSSSSLQKERGEGADVRICYSPLDALELAKQHPDRNVVFLGVGFETTAPTAAATIHRAAEQGRANFSMLTAFKTMPNAMKALLDGGEVALDAFLCPGHVSVITGTGIYEFIAREYRTPCVVSGFEPLDLLQSILKIIEQIAAGLAKVENQYTRAATLPGNPAAQKLLKEVFHESDADWRGIGTIPRSGLEISDEYARFDARKVFPVKLKPSRENPACICGSIMRGAKRPLDCPLFSKVCTPESPKGACMVSDEGSCATYYKYRRTP
ncbi:MAG: hydrogenase formation protein HypD [Bdellovibrionales bacterium GWB1_55_8]|nr:MAG: hydrogenase formation protein HypD [Bdellovibrionales bacterium GWB1_55_8]